MARSPRRPPPGTPEALGAEVQRLCNLVAGLQHSVDRMMAMVSYRRGEDWQSIADLPWLATAKSALGAGGAKSPDYAVSALLTAEACRRLEVAEADVRLSTAQLNKIVNDHDLRADFAEKMRRWNAEQQRTSDQDLED